MSETEEKVGCVKKAWKFVVTGVACAVVGGLVTVGADVAKIQDTITKAQAKNAILVAAQYSAEQVLSKVTVLGTENSKSEAIKVVMEEVEKATPKFIEDATVVKETKKAEVKKAEAKKEVKAEAKKEVKAEAKKEEVNAEVKAEAKKVEAKTAKVKKEAKETTVPKTESKVEVKEEVKK